MRKFVRIALLLLAGLALTCIIGSVAVALLLYLFAVALVLPFTNIVISVLVLSAIFYYVTNKLYNYFKPKAYEIDTTVTRKEQLK